MPRAKSPEREAAYSMWLESGKTMKLRDIAAKLNIPEKTVSGWKSKDGWDKKNERSTPNKERSTPKRKRGAPPGNKNAAGKESGAPLRNHNNLKHGIYAQVFWDVLSDQERDMIDNLPDDEAQHLLDEVRLLTVRERRLMLIIQELGEAKGGLMLSGVSRSEEKREFDSENDKQLYQNRQREKVENDKILPGRAVRVSTTTVNAKDMLMRAHAELTRVQAQKSRVLAQLSQMEILRERLDLEQRRLDLDLMKIEVSQQATTHDTDSSTSNFLDAMMGVTDDVWRDYGKPDDDTPPDGK